VNKSKYKNFHLEKPKEQVRIVWLNSVGKEVFGMYHGKLMFKESDNGRIGYLPKWWREVYEFE
jgi:hypothetical protein